MVFSYDEASNITRVSLYVDGSGVAAGGFDILGKITTTEGFIL